MTDPLLQAMFDRLPSAETEWDVAHRVHWLRCFAAAMVLVYEPHGSIADVDSLLIVAADKPGSSSCSNTKRNGGLARAAALSPERRIQIAKVAADARWQREMVEGDL